MYIDNTDKNSISFAEKNLKFFKNKLEHFFSILSSSLKISRLGTEEYIYEDGTKCYRKTMLEYLHYCITGKSQVINVPKSPINIDLLIGGEDFYTGVTPKISNKFIACIAIDGFPVESYPTILYKLSDIPINSRFQQDLYV